MARKFWIIEVPNPTDRAGTPVAPYVEVHEEGVEGRVWSATPGCSRARTMAEAVAECRSWIDATLRRDGVRDDAKTLVTVRGSRYALDLAEAVIEECRERREAEEAAKCPGCGKVPLEGVGWVGDVCRPCASAEEQEARDECAKEDAAAGRQICGS